MRLSWKYSSVVGHIYRKESWILAENVPEGTILLWEKEEEERN